MGSKAVEEFQTKRTNKKRVNVFILCTEFHTLPVQEMTSGTCSVLLQHVATLADLHVNTVAVIPIFKTSVCFICVRVFGLQLCRVYHTHACLVPMRSEQRQTS